ncbi:sensor histidine kinase [Rhodovarius crocodyli]|uniref:histidine kinase n=1 Tax=Rhodovarius crocodyli TaxID=1979269 RepID=A0A437MIZ5_9PROT|nr:ATP-binding protein [Rhodovarius crocodyli]RVT97612.1 sensor histidine kinase [Rhodovarius crocodyli]
MLPLTTFWLLTLPGLALGAAAGWLLARRGRPPAGNQQRALRHAATESLSIGLALRGRQAPECQALAMQLLEMSDYLEDVLAAEESRRRIHEERVELLPLLEEAVTVASAQLGAAARRCRVDRALEGVALTADRRALRGAVVQVLVRAARLSESQQVIDIRFARLGGMAAIIIEDEGVALPEGDLRQQGMPGSRGLGFGMGLARSLLAALGGDLVFETAPGIGSRAWLTLPEERLLARA